MFHENDGDIVAVIPMFDLITLIVNMANATAEVGEIYRAPKHTREKVTSEFVMETILDMFSNAERPN